MSTDKQNTYLPRPQTARRYGVTERSIARWTLDPDLGFPQPMNINGRLFFAVEQLEAWEKTRAVTFNRKAA
ncbi:DNA-binding protein [Lichenihabitans psoromatis]|uniref:DNA-binding protein n=1 Tax=Lichenihabitans psoromatis TaxID=2528642 RepID=UPI0010363A56|nr:DNA-binding protein [Lichenihabitans psoromatis]